MSEITVGDFCKGVIGVLQTKGHRFSEPRGEAARHGFAGIVQYLELEAEAYAEYKSWHMWLVRLTNALRQNNNGVYEEFNYWWPLTSDPVQLSSFEWKVRGLIFSAAAVYKNCHDAFRDGREMVRLPDGSGCFTDSLPLPKDHWLYRQGANVPPMGLRVGLDGLDTIPQLSRVQANAIVQRAARYAVRASTMNGSVDDWDPDAVVNNMVVGLLGYFTPDGLSPDVWANPGPEGDAARLAMAQEHQDPSILADCLEYTCSCPQVDLTKKIEG